MEKVISSKLARFAYIPILLWALGHMVFVNFGGNDDTFWWIFDKTNDRLCQLLLISFCYFVGYDFKQRLFFAASAVYVIIIASFEVHYIINRDSQVFEYRYLFLSLLLAISVIILRSNHVARGIHIKKMD